MKELFKTLFKIVVVGIIIYAVIVGIKTMGRHNTEIIVEPEVEEINHHMEEPVRVITLQYDITYDDIFQETSL